MLEVLKQCKGDFSRDNVMKQAESLHDLELPIVLPGIKVNTTHTDHRPISSMQFVRWDGKSWVRFGDLSRAPPFRLCHAGGAVVRAVPHGDRDVPL